MKKLKIGEPEIAALEILAGCPTGATSYNLVTRLKVTPETIFNLVANGLALARQHELAGYTFKVTWLQISTAGRALLPKMAVAK